MADSTAVVIRARDLTVRRGGKPVVERLNFDIKRGDIVGLLGPSGCGKSTLMRALVGVQLGVSGTCDVLGMPAGSKPLRTRVGYMTQDASVFTDLSVVENLRYFGSVLGATRDRIESLITEVDLVEQRDRVVGSLSGGQRSRVSLAIAMVSNPELLILDEPTVGLDPVLRRDLWMQFRRLTAEGATLLISSHVMEEAHECDRILIMRDGRLLAYETETTLLQQTSTDNVTDAFLALVEGGSRSVVGDGD